MCIWQRLLFFCNVNTNICCHLLDDQYQGIVACSQIEVYPVQDGSSFSVLEELEYNSRYTYWTHSCTFHTKLMFEF